jgi:hypothetical protein
MMLRIRTMYGWTLVNTVMNCWFHKRRGIDLEQLSDYISSVDGYSLCEITYSIYRSTCTVVGENL